MKKYILLLPRENPLKRVMTKMTNTSDIRVENL